MTTDEFSLIERYFDRPGGRDDVLLGVGDDCALLTVPAGRTLAVSLDVLVEGTHFARGAEPRRLGHKALAVNLSDLAAVGAEAAWVTLGLTLPRADADWLEAFCDGFFALAERHRVALVGGDTTRGPLAVSVQAHGFVDAGAALRRDGARAGDRVFVTGTLGDAALALRAEQIDLDVDDERRRALRDRLETPTPRLAQGLDLRGIASAAIDVSDGLAQDLGHILRASGVGATLSPRRLARSAAAAAVDEREALRAALCGGDDYELCFTAPPQRLDELRRRAADWDCALSECGVIETRPGLRFSGVDETIDLSGYRHF